MSELLNGAEDADAIERTAHASVESVARAPEEKPATRKEGRLHPPSLTMSAGICNSPNTGIDRRPKPHRANEAIVRRSQEGPPLVKIPIWPGRSSVSERGERKKFGLIDPTLTLPMNLGNPHHLPLRKPPDRVSPSHRRRL